MNIAQHTKKVPSVNSSSMSATEQDRLIGSITDFLGKADKPKQERMVGHFTKADSELGQRIAKGIGL
jgi:catalase